MRLLIVEDEHRMARALAKGLAHGGFAVDVVHDGASGVRRATENRYDAIILDVMLPVLSGYDVIRRLRTSAVWTPILVVSAKDGEYDEADGLNLGADDYLTKPFSFVVLVARLQALLRRGAPPRPAALTSGSVSLDPASHSVTKDGAPVELTTREFAMLEYLMRNRHRAVAKVELLEHVWSGGGVDQNAVEVYAGYLRRKLGRDTVQTVRGVGYRIAPA